MADYRDLAAALGAGYGQDTGPITADTLQTLKSGYRSPNFLGMLADIGRGSLSNLESLVRGGVAQVPGTAGDLEALARMGLNKSFGAGGVNVNPETALPTTADIMKMLPQRMTQARPETAGMEELGTVIGPGLGKAFKPLAKAYGNLALEDIAMASTGQPTRSLLGDITPKPLMIVESSNRTFKAPQEEALLRARENAIKLGQSSNEETRMLEQGYYPEWYHGSTGDITNFRPDLLGEATGAASAKKGFFFARDPQNPPASMVNNIEDKEILQFLQQGGLTPEEIAQSATMAGHGAETASGYAQIGGSREYRDAMRKAKSAEKRGDWDEHDKQMQIAEDSEINRMNYAQSMVAKYGDARDTMTEKVNQTFYSLQHPQAQAELLDKKYKELMPYGWYNVYDNKQFNNLKKEIVDLVGEKEAAKAIKTIDDFQRIKNERAVLEKTQQGGNVMPVALRYKNPMVHDFKGKAYREQTYSDLIDQALRGGHDALILKNTFDPGGGPAKLVDVGVVFSPDQIRSKFAAFDPLRKDVAIATASGLALPDLLAAEKKDKQKKLSKALAK